jgi:hypothetical protein
MKNLMTNCILAAVALAVMAGSASAQILKADIPFTFHAGKTLMLPGTYEVNLGASATRSYFLLRNVDTNTAVLLAAYIRTDIPKEWQAEGSPKVAFECTDGRCILRNLWSGSDTDMYRFQGPKPGRDGDLHVTEITMTRAKAD